MDELDKGLGISVKGDVRERALGAFVRQITVWNVAMSPVEPLVLDFGLGDFDHTGLIEYWIANEAEAGYCGKYLFVFDGQSCPEHRHQVKHETFLVVQGRCEMSSGGRSWIMQPGDVFPVPRGQRHAFTGRGPCLLLELSMPCEIADNDFTNRDIPIGANAASR